ncbi:MAG TPA: response regulator transcription factor [Solirubrobacteraceae bacterium]|nr:response regulator transcription factor [Solirubrobacteraceae bacterium]
MDPYHDDLRVVLADDHHFFREGLRDMLTAAGMTVVGEAKDGAQAVALAESLKPDVIVIDLDMPDAAGAEALRRIAAASPKARTVILTRSAGEEDVLDALEAGACGYILKDAAAEDLVASIRHTAGSHAVLSREVVRTLVAYAGSDNHRPSRSSSKDDTATLTARERDVLKLLAGGADNATIGLELSISRHTVKQHVTNIFEKLGVRTRVEAAVYAVRAGLL